jgi:4-diphosphocytidyl-2-C-methyl-D-erythritol kinase
VLGSRADGFHEVETLLLALDWGDDVEVALEDGEGIALEVVSADADVPTGEGNLAWRAAALYREAAERAGRPLHGRIRLRLVKRIPPGAGLGGGSSDAACVLAGLEDVCGALGVEALPALAAALGSDVPFGLLSSGVAVGRGRGELLTELGPVPPRDLVLILPGTRHDTGRVYAHADANPSPRVGPGGGLDAAVAALVAGDAPRLCAAQKNALLPAALAAYPGFAALVGEVTRRLGHPPALSGSGSTLFDLPAPDEVDAVLGRLAGIAGRVVHVRSGS